MEPERLIKPEVGIDMLIIKLPYTSDSLELNN